ncbi:MAG: hypothetical protein HC929_14020 [Leptolyngbyaceae cyanobacterium SM2_5_2]|nr:hypothetical protein [Leptolyngbyaceae cyanobacterium SM2_5_2]
MVTSVPKKKAFSKFTLAEAYKQLGLERVVPWHMEFAPVSPTDAFRVHLQRLQAFDMQRSEEGKKLLIDAILLEAVQDFKTLKFWKGVYFEGPNSQGTADYLMTGNRDYFEAPLLCVIEAKKDDFEQGLAQCLVEMQACQWSNAALGRMIAIFGIVTNGEGWKFYQLKTTGEVLETLLFSVSELGNILGQLKIILRQCEANLDG